MEREVLLEIKNLTTEFITEEGHLTKAVDGISLSLRKGETIGIVGESGSGKSVTALSAMRLIPTPPGKISSGEILYRSKNGEINDLLKTDNREMRKFRGNEIAMIFQEPMTSLNPVITCGEQIVEAILLHEKISKAQAKNMVIELFKKVKLPRPNEMFDAYPHQLSGGQKQRVMIAMAMSCDPQILIADEPTTALDVTVQKTILDLMMEIQRDHAMGIMFITHDLGVIAEIADTVVVMYKGKIVEHGSVMEIFQNPRHPFTKGLLSCRPPLDRRLRFLPTVSDFLSHDTKNTLIETGKSVDEAINAYVITDEERKKQHDVLYRGQKLLEVKNIKSYFPLKKSFLGKVLDVVKAVDDVSFDVFEGETLGLVGESGCGKTTLGKTIMRLIKPTSGEIRFRGKNIATLADEEMRLMRKEMQVIFQDPYSSLNPRMTIGEAIMEPLRVHKLLSNDKQRKEKVMNLLRKVNLSEQHFYKYPHEFSGGQRQRICIARALVLDPSFILCDEMVSALDVSVQAQVLNLLNELKKEFNFTYVFISHDLSVVKFMSDRIAVMENGKILEMGEADEICNSPKNDYTKKLISSILRGRKEDIQASVERKQQFHPEN